MPITGEQVNLSHSARNERVFKKDLRLRLHSRFRALWLALCALLICMSSASPQEAESAPRTNLELLRQLAFNITLQAGRHSELETGAREASLVVYPQERSWYIEGALIEGLKSLGFSFSGASPAPVRFEFGILDAGIEYANAGKESLFGSKLVDRVARLGLEVKITMGDDAVQRVFVSSYKDTILDKIEFSAIQRVENRLIPITQGVLPREGFFANLAEPLIVVGSIAVAVLLLFNVRS